MENYTEYVQKLKKQQELYCGRSKKLNELILELQDDTSLSLLVNKEKLSKSIKGLEEKLSKTDISISVVAEVSNGKSTFLNALIFKNTVLDSGLGAVTARVFVVKYGKKYTIRVMGRRNISDEYELNNLEELKKKTKEINEKTRENIDNKVIKNDELGKIILALPHPELQKGIVLYDTPGFGALDNNIVFPLIQEAIDRSDATIILLDISQGLKKKEKEFVKESLKYIPPKERFVVFNKLDATISEDQLALKSKEDIEREINNLQNKTLREISHNIPLNEIKAYCISAMKALAGYIKNDNNRLRESRFEDFEKSFWEHIANNREEIVNLRINTYKNIWNSIYKTTDKIIYELEDKIKELEQLKVTLMQEMAEFKSFSKEARLRLQESIDILKELDKKLEFDPILEKIREILKKNIINELDGIGFFDKVLFWNLKDTYTKGIEKAVSNSEPEIRNELIEYQTEIQSALIKGQNTANATIKSINSKIEKFKNLKPIEEVVIIKREGNNNYKIVDDDTRKEILELNDSINIEEEIDGEISLALKTLFGGLIIDVILFSISDLIPGIGFIIAVIISKIFGKSKEEKNESVADKITEEIMNKIRISLKDKKEIYEQIMNIVIEKIQNTLILSQDRLKGLESAMENPEKKEYEINKIKQDLNYTIDFKKKLENLKYMEV